MDETQTPHADVVPRQVGPEHYAYHGPEGATKLSTTVVHALADVMGEDITDTGFKLYDSIDPDGLDRIFSSSGSIQSSSRRGYQGTVGDARSLAQCT
jgi:hypothetical protein